MKNDVFNDANNTKLYKASKLVVLPDFVKEAEEIKSQNFSTTASDQFADPGKRKYPCNTKSNAWLSRMYFNMDKEAMDRCDKEVIGRNIEKWASFWDLEDTYDVQPTLKKPDYYNFDIKDRSNNIVTTVTIPSKQHYKEASESLYTNRSKFTYDMRKQYARGLMSAPSDIKEQLHEKTAEYLEKAAGFGMTTREEVGELFLDRISSLNRTHPEYADKLAKYASETPLTITPAYLQKTAELISIVDNASGLSLRYNRDVSTPEEVLFRVLEKEAQMVKDEMIIMQDGKTRSKTELLNKTAAINGFFQDYFGEVPYGSDSEMVDVVSSLPKSDAEAFNNIVE